MTIRALHSDVILHVPDGVYGIILGNIHTDHWRFRHLVGRDDCIISPICEFDLVGSKVSNERRFRIQVSNIAQDPQHLKDIKVKYGIKNNLSTANKFTRSQQTNDNVSFKVTRSYVDIYAHHFCKFIIYAEERNCCGQSIAVVSFSKLEIKDSRPVATAILYFCSVHHIWKGYQKVCSPSHNDIYFVL